MSLANQAPPSWLVEEEDKANGNVSPHSPVPNLPSNHASMNHSVGSVEGGSRGRLTGEEEKKARMVFFGIKGITMLLCAAMFITAVVHMQEVNGVTSSGQLFVATYMIFFSILLAAFEVAQMQKIIWLDHMLRRNFGFLYSAMGKALFIIFVAFLCLGLDGASDMPMMVGIAVATFGGAQVALYLKNPEYFEYCPPGYDMLLAEQEQLNQSGNSNNAI